MLHVEGNVDDAVQRFYYETIGPYWPPERRHVEGGYRNLPFPFKEVALPPLAIDVDWGLDDLIGYIGTWSAVKAAVKATGSNPVEALDLTLRKAWGDPASRRRVTWPLSIRAGQNEHGMP